MTTEDVTEQSSGPSLHQIRSDVTQFLARYVDDVAILDQERLITGGWLDSLAAVCLIAHLERSFGLDVSDDDLELANFDSLEAITDLVCRKLAE